MPEFVIEHPDGGKWFSQWGWVQTRESALRFASVAEAQNTADTVQQARGGEVRAAEMAEDKNGNKLFETRTDYNPFGRSGV